MLPRAAAKRAGAFDVAEGKTGRWSPIRDADCLVLFASMRVTGQKICVRLGAKPTNCGRYGTNESKGSCNCLINSHSRVPTVAEIYCVCDRAAFQCGAAVRAIA